MIRNYDPLRLTRLRASVARSLDRAVRHYKSLLAIVLLVTVHLPLAAAQALEADTLAAEPRIIHRQVTYIGVEEPDQDVAVEIIAEAVTLRPVERHKSVFWSLHTNMLYDVALVPNLGFEVYLGKNISLAGNYWNAWWKSQPKNRFWRTYGAYLACRYWFGKAAHAKPLTGHHAGVYVQAMLYDFEWGGTGYLSGDPGKNIFHHPTLAAGLEYGYTLPIGRRLNLDFTIGIGYLQGQYQKYIPDNGCYRWLSTHEKRWFGPTKLEVSLVWLLGSDNFNQK